ncbi:p450 domain containing protein [Asbolus verrucosus]|uniref:p450 domain containing protein n=1 Tax=Asbolus verrucosus TaxID=1661398 RepID=A0A482VN38_ASBVE|nr:p450 domain containing protein [Asbolus verrucosus]
MMEMCKKYKPIGKLWVGLDLMITVTQPKDIELLTETFLDKSQQYKVIKEGLGDGLITASVEKWKLHREAIIHNFDENILSSYTKVFVKHAKILANTLKKDYVKTRFDVYWKFFGCTFDIICESCIDLNFDSVQQNQYMLWIARSTEITGHRLFHPLHQIDILWDLGSVSNELTLISWGIVKFVRQIVARIKFQNLGKNQDEIPQNFINNLMTLTYDKKIWTEEELVDETQTILAAGTNSTALTNSFFMLMMAIHQDVQEKIYQELFTIFGEDNRDVTLEDLAQMTYLERSIKETMRLFPAVPIIGRSIDKDFILDGYVLPKGSSLLIPIAVVHRDPSIWKIPLKFDPDRFLPEEFQKIPRGAYMPFGLPPRNCIGSKFAMVSMKVVLSTILRNFRVVSCQYRSIEEIKFRINILIKATNGYGITLESRLKQQ